MREKKAPREYPGIYEKLVPVAIGLLALIVLAVLAFTIAIGVGLIHFG